MKNIDVYVKSESLEAKIPMVFLVTEGSLATQGWVLVIISIMSALPNSDEVGHCSSH